ncbi:MBL fold metallo-hydrolase [Actinophytocola sp.]|uniref:MBL fold metallo-hydrolase n=1 Tax=Actinophytocola sp. TaxID=1872138 RepID=UPI002D62CDAA|nr:MBL fold metallo-hydrolase [Actinophytocola sp.]HYQ69503.1 MBL fold metallo-hydrolase [Actinophytocola sp.]
MSTRSVGRLSVVALRDARGPFVAWEVGFPAATPREWALARAFDADAFGPDGRWLLDFRAFAIMSPSGVTLVDAGIGPVGAPAEGWAPVPGALPDVLAATGIDPSDVDTVVLTHLHADHCGWAVTPAGEPLFPNARYVVHREELAWVNGAVASYVVKPLRAAGVLSPVAAETVLLTLPTGEKVTVVPTPGHTPGHQSVLVEGGGARVVVTGDVLVHAVQLVSPGVAYVYEEDPVLARETRQRLLARAAGGELATPHLTEPFVRVR